MEEKNEQKTRNVVVEFIRAYKQKPDVQSNVDWLNGQFAKYPDLWASEEERKKDAGIIVETVEKFDKGKAELNAHIASGKSHESYFISKIEAAATAQGVTNVTSYASNIDKAINDANRDMIERCYCHNPDGSIDFTRINQNPNLDGNIAETHHAGTFNIDAAAKESNLHAKALESNTKNSVDLQVYDGDGNVVKRYQSKYGKDAETTGEYFKNGDYRGQRKLVPEEQAEELPGSTGRMEAGGVRSKALTKEEAKRMQERTQESGQIQQYEWNDANKV